MDQNKILKAIDKQSDIVESLCSRGIHTDDQYDQAREIIDLFMRINKLTKPQEFYLNSMIVWLVIYERKHFSF